MITDRTSLNGGSYKDDLEEIILSAGEYSDFYICNDTSCVGMMCVRRLK